MQHNLNGIIDCVVRWNGLNRIIPQLYVNDNNSFTLIVPEQLEFGPNDFLEIIVYKLDEIPNFHNVFQYFSLDPQINENTIKCNLPSAIYNQTCIESILTDSESNGRIVIPSEIITSDNTIQYLKTSNINKTNINIYTSKWSEHIIVPKPDLPNLQNIVTADLHSDQIVYGYLNDEETKEQFLAIKIPYTITGEPNIIIRKPNRRTY